MNLQKQMNHVSTVNVSLYVFSLTNYQCYMFFLFGEGMPTSQNMYEHLLRNKIVLCFSFFWYVFGVCICIVEAMQYGEQNRYVWLDGYVRVNNGVTLFIFIIGTYKERMEQQNYNTLYLADGNILFCKFFWLQLCQWLIAQFLLS